MTTGPLPIFDEVLEFRDTLNPETDRGCALMASSYLDEQLKLLIGKTLVQNAKLFKKLTGAHGPLATFSARIDFAYLLGLLGPKAQADIHLIREIRNEFGHSAKPLSFDDPGIAELCSKLYHDAGVEKLAPRRKFTRVVLGVLAPIHFRESAAVGTPEAPDVKITAERAEKFRKMSDEDRLSMIEAKITKEPNSESSVSQQPQRDAGSRPSSGDSPASEAPSSLGPRG